MASIWPLCLDSTLTSASVPGFSFYVVPTLYLASSFGSGFFLYLALWWSLQILGFVRLVWLVWPFPYVDVATFEVSIGGLSEKSGFRDTVHSGVSIVVSNPLNIDLKFDIVDEISICMADFSTNVAIFYFKGFWPSLSDLHAWISHFWDPIISEITHIYPMPRGFFIVKFESNADKDAILRHVFYWEVKFPLMAKPSHNDFNPLIESFNKFPIWVRLLNLPLHLWVDPILEEVGRSLGGFHLIDKDSINVFRMMYARILVEIDVSKELR